MPKVDNNHFTNYMFQMGGAAIQAPMQEPQDISQDIMELIQMYAQATGMDDQQMQQAYESIIQMEPQQQSQVIAQMQQELASTMAANPMTAKTGGYIKETKKLLSKKIGGVSTNQTSENVVDMRKAYFKDAIGEKLAKNVVDEVAEDNMRKANNMLGQASQNFKAAQPTMDYGGFVNTPAGGGFAYGAENPFITDVNETRQGMFDSFDNLFNQLGTIRTRPVGDIKVKRRGDIFENKTYQDGSTVYMTPTHEQVFQDMGIKDEDYVSAMNAVQSGNYTPEQLNLIDRVEARVGTPTETPYTTTSTQTTQSQTGAQGLNGWNGGYFWQNGIPIMSIYDAQQQQQQGFDMSQLFLPGNDRNIRIQGNLLDLARNPQVVKQFGQALTKFQPDNVYLSKAKARVNPFGAKAVFKWDYEDGEEPTFKERFKNMFNRTEATPMTKEELGYNFTEPPFTQEQESYLRQSLALPGTTPVGAFGPLPNEGPRVDTEEMMYGGIPKAKAGQFVIKQQFRPYGSDIAQSYSPFADVVSSALEMQGLQQQEDMAYLPDFFMPSITPSNLSMGTKGTGPLTGSENRFASRFGLTGNYADSLYQNEPVFGTAASFGYQGYNRAYGGNIYEDGGMTEYREGDVYELSDEEVANILAQGGQVQYY